MTLAAILIDLQNVECATKESAEILEDIIKRAIAYDKKQQKQLAKLNALQCAGVDNWEGYDIAMQELYSDKEEDNE